MDKYDKGLRLIAAAEKAQAAGRLRSLARRFDMRIAGVAISDGRRVAFCVLRLCSEARAGTRVATNRPPSPQHCDETQLQLFESPFPFL